MDAANFFEEEQTERDRLELLAYLLAEEGIETEQTSALIPRARGERIPLSFGQQRLWFVEQFESESAFYNISAAVRLQGSLRRDLLERSLQEIVRRHEILRTTFTAVDGIPWQVIAEESSFSLAFFDRSMLSGQEQEEDISRLLTSETRQPFDLEQGPLFRLSLFKLAEQNHIFSLTIHHSIADDWSIDLFIVELMTLYRAFLNRQVGVLPALPVQYADYAIWQRQQVQGEALQAKLAYWQENLQDIPRLSLPTDHSRPGRVTYQGATQHFTVPPHVVSRLKEIAHLENATLFMTCLAAFHLLLSRYSGQSDIVIGTSVSDRRQSELEGLIGFFVNMLALRLTRNGNPTFYEWLASVREVTLEAYAHQDVPFEKVVEAIQPERSLSRMQLFQVMFVLHSASSQKLTLPDLEVFPLPQKKEMTDLDLGLDMVETTDGLHGIFEYSRELFQEATIVRCVDHFLQLLEEVTAHPERPVATLPMLTPGEYQQIVVEWNRTASHFPSHQCLHQIIEEQVERVPDATAVVFQNERLSYREMNARANQLAHYLQHLGVGPEICVGICLEHSLEMLISMLAVIKAGGVYIPLDQTLPGERLLFITQETQIAVLITQEALREVVPIPQPIPVISLDRDSILFSHFSQENVESTVTPGNLIYIVFTSGSTGVPKGVMITHATLVNMFYSWDKTYHLQEILRAQVQMANFYVDLFPGDAIRALCTGKKLVMCPHEDILDAQKLYALLVEEQVNSAEFVPAVLRNLLDYLEQTGQRLDFMDLLTAGADSWSARDYQAVRSLVAPTTRICNAYGSTEVTIDSTYFDGGEKYTTTKGVVPIGRPFPDTETYLLDSALQPVPVGIPGEIYIGGQRIARGYLRRPDLTAERFLPNPFSQKPGARLYRTGDLGRYLPDGSIDFLGRADFQVKIRGFRIELAEIETALRRLPEIKEAVVLLHERSPQDTYLVAYVVPAGDQPLESQILRERLASALPSYMLPSLVMFLEQIPLTSTGKLNRRALPVPAFQATGHGQQVQLPRTPMEELVAQIWREVLGVERVGIREQFFELGGHSLLATQVMARLQSVLHIELPLRTLFESSTIEALARRIQEKLFLGQQSVQFFVRQVRTRPPHLPLSHEQEQIWFLHQMQPESTFYHIPAILRLQGTLAYTPLQQSLAGLVQRHEILRTIFPAIDGKPEQVILPQFSITLSIRNLEHIPASERTAVAHKIVKQEIEQPFQLADGPAWRFCLVRLHETEHFFVLTFHHIIADGWSLDIFLRELSDLYAASLLKRPPTLKKLDLHYVDYACWQREWMQGEAFQQHLAYWQNHLEGAPPLLAFPTDYQRPTVQRHQGAALEFVLPDDLSQAIKELSQREGCTLFMTLCAAWQVLLMCYTRETDIVTGTPVANRLQAGLEDIPGFFVNTLVLRTDLAHNPTVQELLHEVRATCLEAYTHQTVPFDLLVNALQPVRSLSYNPLFQVMFSVQNELLIAEQFPGLTASLVPAEHHIAKFDLSLDIIESTHGLRGAFEYDTDLFTATTIERMLVHWQRLLEQMVTSPQRRIADLLLLSPNEREQILLAWSKSYEISPGSDLLPALIDRQSLDHPLAPAVVYQQTTITYQELYERSNRLASYLQKRGVQAETRVGVYLANSTDMVIAFLGILKAGGAYVPLDPALPPERLRFILHDADITCIVTLQHWETTFLETSGVTLVCLDREETLIQQEASQPVMSQVGPSNLAYVLYTSGSTGFPKGVMIAHANLIHVAHMWREAYHLEATSSHLQQANNSFDVCSGEIIRALSVGAKLVIAEREDILKPHRLSALLRQEQVDCAEFTPALLRLLVEHIEHTRQSLSFLRVLIAGSDMWNREEYARVQALVGEQTLLVNSYGVTEATIDSTCFIGTGASFTTEYVPIGRPFPDTETYLLDSALQPVPVGIPGEIYIGGQGVGRGYIRRPDLTAERFLPNPFSQKPGARLYRTGDLGRYLPDGSIDFLGRADFQVKIRGFRIELAEIETALRRLPEIKEAVVLLHERSPQDTYLVAYVVPAGDQPLESQILRERLSSALPSYMLPSLVMFLEQIPLTSTGKLDRRALPVPAFQATGRGQQVQLPRTPMEELVAQIWREVLGVKRVGIREQFFELGGHSLLATQVMARLQSVLHIELPLRTLFESSTIEALARRIQESRAEQSAGPRLERVERQAGSPLLLSYAQQRLWFLHRLEPDSPAYVMFEALHLQGQLHLDALEQSLQLLVERHEILRTTIINVRGEPRQIIAAQANLVLRHVPVTAGSFEEREAVLHELIQREAQKPFHLATDSPIRVTLFQLNAQEHVLLVCLHHIAADGWSIAIFTRELSTFYAAFAAGERPQIPALTWQYVDYAYWQHKWLQGSVLLEQLAYWQRELEGAPSLLDLPLDHARPLTRTYSGETISFELSLPLLKRLQELSKSENTTLFMTLLAAFTSLLWRYSGQDDIVVGTPVANRVRPEFEEIIGFFVNTLALRTRFVGQPGFREVLAQVRKVCVEAYTYQSVPFEQVIEAVQPERHLNYAPLFQVMFILQNTPQAELELADLTLRPLKVEDTTADFDLTLSLEEHAEGIHGVFAYSTELFERSTIERMKEDYSLFLEAVVTHPDIPIHMFPFLSERKRIPQIPPESVLLPPPVPVGQIATPTEERLCMIWADLLHVVVVDVNTNFFELGGHSLMAMRLFSRIEETFHVELAVRTIFTAPTVALLAACIDEARTKNQRTTRPTLSPVTREGTFPLSFVQQRLWILDQLEPGSPRYTIPAVVRLEGTLNETALEQALQEVIRRQESLRTVFSAPGGQPYQIIVPEATPPFRKVSLLEREDREHEALRLIQEEMQQPFDLIRLPLWRVLLVQLSQTRFLLALTIHHIIADGWSLDILLRELNSLYNSYQAEKPVLLPPLRQQYVDYAHWQRTWLQGSVLQDQLRYWQMQLAGAPPLHTLPTDRPRPPVQSYRGANCTFRLPAGLTTQLKALSIRENVTLFMTLLAALQVLLMRYSGQTDILIGSPIANRPQTDLEQVVGCFLNTLVLRADLSGNPRFRQYLQRVQVCCLDAYAHQDVPFEQIVEALHLERNLSYEPLFQILFALYNPTDDVLQFNDLTTTSVDLAVETARFDLTFEIEETASGLLGNVEYSTDLFEQATIERLIGHFQTLLAGIVAEPDTSLLDLPLFAPGEVERIVVGWNTTQCSYPDLRCLHELIAEQARRTPAALAVKDEQQALTYEELEKRATKLARRVRAAGGRAESFVALYVERSVEMVVALLAILKTGAAYLPLDPTYPSARLALMLEDAQAVAVLTHSQLVEQLPAHTATVICLDQEDPEQPAEEAIPLALAQEASLSTAAYLLYTSGSTGRPKGVVIEQRTLVHFLYAMRDELSFSAREIWLAVTTLSFDIAALEIFLPLLTGAQVVIATRDDTLDSLRLAALIERSDCTFMQATPSTWRLLCSTGWAGRPNLAVLCGGEALSQDLAVQLQEKTAQVWNVYGPTETTIWSTLHPLTSRTEPVAIGRPLANTQTYVLDAHLQPVPIGVPGELYIGGLGVARGYLHLPALTAERFVPNPYQAGERLYRTGDLVRYRADGCLEYLYRLDTQVKVRGHRIELAEIETILRQHPHILEAVVLVQQDRNARQFLVAYLVLADQQKPAGQEALRAYLGRYLPDYMQPSRFIVVEALPFTPNGKLDRQALIHLSGQRLGSDLQFVPASTPMEQLLTEIWSDVLETAEVGIHDNFFALGGDSILAIQVIAQARQRQVFLTLRQLFQYQTIAQLVEVCTEINDQSAQAQAAEEMETAYPLSPGQRGLLFHTLTAPEGEMYFEQICCKLQGRLNVTALQEAWQRVVEQYSVLRSAFAWEELREPLQMTQAGVQLPWVLLDWTDLTVSEAQSRLAAYLAADRQRGFDLTQAPLMRMALFRLDQETSYFVWSYHHLLLDGWSVSLLLKSVWQIYQALRKGQTLQLPAVRPYRDYVIWRDSQDQAAAERFWRQELAGFTSPTTLFCEFQPAELLLHDPQQEEEHMLPVALTARLRALASRHQLTLHTILQGAWATLLSCWSGEKDILYGTVTSGRSATLEGIENMLGLFISTLPVRVQLPPQMTVVDWLKQLQDHLTLLQHYDYSALSDIQKWSMVPSSRPLFTSMFLFENYPVDRSLLTWDADIQVEDVISVERTSYPLSVVASPGDALWLRANYDSRTFAASDIRDLLHRLQIILERIVDRPEHYVGELNCITEDERTRMLYEWNSTEQAYPDRLCLHQLFEAQVTLHPEALAVISEDERLSYGEFNRRANQLAAYLQKRGVGPGSHVGLYLERSVELLVSILAVLKVGGVYVPLESDYPQERLAWMLQDASITTVLTQQRLIDPLQERPSLVQVIVIDAEQASISVESPENIPCQVTSQHLAYILYTSGSTGRPKGVMIAHQALVNYLSWCCQAYNVAEGEGAPVYTRLSFDLTCTSLFAPLLVGRSLFLFPPTGKRDVEMLSQVLQARANLSLVKMTPTHLELLNHLLPAQKLAGRANVLVLGGEALLGHHVHSWQVAAPHTRLINEYGPTEATVGCCVYELSPEETVAASVPIGRPIANVQLYVLDAHLQPVPIGVPAELYIGGSGLAYGYLNRPELTAERFLPHPFSSLPGARLYKTGDLVRYLPDGTLEFLGRLDTQVKLRGYRIELAEIETLLLQHPGVQEAVVTLWDAAPGDQRLVAYIVPASEVIARPPGQDLRAFLLNMLPEYMVPDMYISLDRLPVTDNGKLDRQGLPLPGEQIYQGRGFVEPQTENERLLATIWCEVLRVEKVGIHDTFFALGGHSLLLLQVHTKLQQYYQIELVDLFAYPTISTLAEFLRSGKQQALRPLATQQAQKRRTLQKQQRLARQQLH